MEFGKRKSEWDVDEGSGRFRDPARPGKQFNLMAATYTGWA